MDAHEHTVGSGKAALYVSIVILLVCTAGLMSGLTLGLMSLDLVDLQVLLRSGTAKERKYAARIMPLLQRPHLLLVTLLLCNAAAMEALPIFLDELTSPVAAVAISVTAVLIFGEILPQAACKAYGLAVGYHSYWIVSALVTICFVISWPISKLLDWVLGSHHSALFRRHELRALVDLHGTEEGMHGAYLTPEETDVIIGALDLRHKTAEKSMTPLSKVTMISADAKLDEATLRPLLALGHSRIPVHAPGRREETIGLLLVKDLVLLDKAAGLTPASLPLRRLPSMPVTTPMYELLKVFQTGRAHMVVLTGVDPQEATSYSAPVECKLAPTGRMRVMADATTTGRAAQDLDSDTPLLAFGGSSQNQEHPQHIPTHSRGPGDTAVNISALHQHQQTHDKAASTQGIELSSSPRLLAHHGSGAGTPGHCSSCVDTTEAGGARAGEPVGIITLEDVIEELIQREIQDGADHHLVSNARLQAAQSPPGLPAAVLPAQLRTAIAMRRTNDSKRWDAFPSPRTSAKPQLPSVADTAASADGCKAEFS